MTFHFCVNNKDSPKDELNLISGQFNLDAAEKNKPAAHLRTVTCESTAAVVESYWLILALVYLAVHWLRMKN